MIFDSFPKYNATIVPAPNYKRGKEVNKYIEHYAKRQQLKQEEAFQVQGADLIIWNRLFTPRICTCQGLESTINNNPAVLQDARPTVVASQQHTITTDLNLPTNNQVKYKTKKQLNNILTDAALQDLSSVVDSLYEDTGTIVEETSLVTPKVSSLQSSLLEEAFIKQKTNLGVEYSDYNQCPICFGTKHTDAYQPHRGVRLVLDASDYYTSVLHKAAINKQKFPHVVDFLDDTDSSITWTVTLPKYFKAVSIKPYALEVESTSVSLSFAEVGSNTFTPLSLTSLQERSGSNNVLQIKCSLNADNIRGNLKNLQTFISHVEVVLLYNDVFDKGELPILTIPEQIDFQELYLRSRIVLAPSITSLNREDLICENKYGLLWKVIDVEKSYTLGGTLTLLRAEIRLVQNSEKLYNLALFARKLNSVKPNL